MSVASKTPEPPNRRRLSAWPDERKAIKDQDKQKMKALALRQKAELHVVVGPILAVRHQLTLKRVQTHLPGLPKALRDALDALANIPEDQVQKISLSPWGRP